LIDSMTVDFDPDEYHDNYREALQELVDAKVEGREVVQPEGPSEPAELTSLADALKASLAAAQGAPHRAGEVTVAAAPQAIGGSANGGKKSRSAAKGAGTRSAGTKSAEAKTTEAKTGRTGRGGTADAETKADASQPAAAEGTQPPAAKAKRSAKGAAASSAQSKTRRRAS
jgi:DNA end-binding protein Ku